MPAASLSSRIESTSDERRSPTTAGGTRRARAHRSGCARRRAPRAGRSADDLEPAGQHELPRRGANRFGVERAAQERLGGRHRERRSCRAETTERAKLDAGVAGRRCLDVEPLGSSVAREVASRRERSRASSFGRDTLGDRERDPRRAVRSRASRPGFTTASFSSAMWRSVGPSQRVCSSPTLVSTCTRESITLVAS